MVMQKRLTTDGGISPNEPVGEMSSLIPGDTLGPRVPARLYGATLRRLPTSEYANDKLLRFR